MATIKSILAKKSSDIISVSPDVSVRDAAGEMIDANVGCLVVADAGRVVGVFTERDLLWRVVGSGKDPDRTPISDVMTSPVHTCSPDDDVAHCFDILQTSSFRHLVAAEEGRPVGMISIRDVALALHGPISGVTHADVTSAT